MAPRAARRINSSAVRGAPRPVATLLPRAPPTKPYCGTAPPGTVTRRWQWGAPPVPIGGVAERPRDSHRDASKTISNRTPRQQRDHQLGGKKCLQQFTLQCGNSTAVLPKTPHSNSCTRVPNRPLRPRRGRFGTLLHQLKCGIFGRTAEQPSRGRFGTLLRQSQ